MRNKKLANLIDNSLGKRVKQATYSYSDILLYWIYSNICGAERLEDTVFLKSHLDSIPDLAVPSPDRISGILRSLATPKFSTPTKSGSIHEFSTNMALNKLMLDIAKKLDVISGDILDYDNVIIETEKYDSNWTYKKTKGYQPGVAFIGQTPVYIEARNGNSPAAYRMSETLDNCIRLLKSKNIPLKYFRSDSAAYQFDVIKLMDANKIEFFIRADTNRQLKQKASLIEDWQMVESEGSNYEVGEMEYQPFQNKYAEKPTVYRAIVKRVTNSEGKIFYYSILTSNWTILKAEALHFYNQRGAMERNFDDLKNNFNWKRLPFSYLNENLVFMILGAISNIVYSYIIKAFSKKVDFVKKTFRLKNFIFHFITVSSLWKKGKLKLFTDKNYLKIFE